MKAWTSLLTCCAMACTPASVSPQTMDTALPDDPNNIPFHASSHTWTVVEDWEPLLVRYLQDIDEDARAEGGMPILFAMGDDHIDVVELVQ
ncbi:MAG: hypothetical protein KTR31_35880 [Myxococcales bacterium]|nr:hypothetical protein [Myxococcales bacterium]